MSIGKEPDEIDAEQPDTNDVADALGFDDLADGQPDDDLPSRAEMWQVIQTQSETIDQLEDRVGDLEEGKETADRNRQEIAQQMTEAVDTAAQAKEIANSANGVAEQAKDIAETGETAFDREDPEGLPSDVEPSSSTLDFYANCRQYRVKKHLVDTGTPYRNRFRALLVAKRWDEFATKRTNGTGVFWTRDDVEEALTAILHESPHYETVSRVWDAMKLLGGSDVEENQRRVSNTQDSTRILSMDRDTAEGLLESRYHHLELLNADGEVTGVTPVVIDNETAEV